jgi:hypothetical protein
MRAAGDGKRMGYAGMRECGPAQNVTLDTPLARGWGLPAAQVGVHFFSFGGFEATASWARANLCPQ